MIATAFPVSHWREGASSRDAEQAAWRPGSVIEVLPSTPAARRWCEAVGAQRVGASWLVRQTEQRHWQNDGLAAERLLREVAALGMPWRLRGEEPSAAPAEPGRRKRR